MNKNPIDYIEHVKNEKLDLEEKDENFKLNSENLNSDLDNGKLRNINHIKIKDIKLEEFNERKKLKNILRYSNYKVMFYRTDVFFHSKKIFFLVREVIPYIKSKNVVFNEKKTLTMALVHDDVETIIGDFQAGNRFNMSKKELENLDNVEKVAICELAKISPKYVNGFVYEDLLLEVLNMNTIESQIVKYLDHFDAFCEAIHEIVGGNNSFLKRVINEYGEVPSPVEYYIYKFSNYKKYYPLLEKLIGEKIPFLLDFKLPDFQSLEIKFGEHNLDNIKKDFFYEPYNWWRKILVRNLSKKDLKNLYIKKKG
ncbi:MAG: HD domain-containing protein [Nanoarchaeota archaeon]|nr:HD domain-containing protein [Nanoarchaeota archaeon]